MASLTSAIAGVVTGLISPVTGLLTKKQEVREARQAMNGALAQSKVTNEHAVTVNDQHLESIMAEANKTSWKDEYVTVSLVCIINAVVLGGILQGFGYPQFMAGVLTGVTTLSSLIDLKTCMTATIYAAIGLSVWRKV